MTIFSVSFTEPISETRPVSLRPRSISIKCSAISLSSDSRSSSSARSASSLAPRGRVPAIGRTVIRLSSTRTSTSGELPTTWKSPKLKKYM
ncbi:hypothetical protein D9M71_673050 [compost metagenome]